MFKWLQRMDPESSGLARMQRQFAEMLDEGRHIFDAASNAFLGGADPEVIRQDLFRTDKRINELEQIIRRELVIHGTVHGLSQLPACLVFMSIVKDAERIGDYCKNLYDLAVVQKKHKEDDYYADLVELKDKVSHQLAEAKLLHSSQDAERSKEFLRRGDALQDHCDAQITRLLEADPGTLQPAATALAYRYLKRVIAHVLNIVTSIVMPVDQLDYFDEDKATRS